MWRMECSQLADLFPSMDAKNSPNSPCQTSPSHLHPTAQIPPSPNLSILAVRCPPSPKPLLFNVLISLCVCLLRKRCCVVRNSKLQGSPVLVPPWLETLLSTPFFSVCRAHDDSPTAPRSECNMFCLDCATAPAGKAAFCYCCRANLHNGHQVIQIRRSSYHDVVRVSEVQRALDISGVQTYVINSARVMFLNERPQPRSTGKASAHICEICNRSLLDPFRFCSLGCKLVGIKRNRNASFVVMKVEDQEEEEEDEKKKELSPGLREEGQHAMYNHTHSSSSPPKAKPRRRKGVPRRSPLGT